MPVSIGAPAQAGFDQPLDLMKDCHRRIESFLGMLLRVSESARERPLDDAERRALEAALKYFREAAPRHTQDEEESLFPRLRRNTSPEALAALDRVRQLETEHLRANALHDAVDAAGRQWLRDGRLSPETVDAVHQNLCELRDLYRRHIHVEDSDIFPLAGKTLSSEELAAIGSEMQARRSAPGASSRPGV